MQAKFLRFVIKDEGSKFNGLLIVFFFFQLTINIFNLQTLKILNYSKFHLHPSNPRPQNQLPEKEWQWILLNRNLPVK